MIERVTVVKFGVNQGGANDMSSSKSVPTAQPTAAVLGAFCQCQKQRGTGWRPNLFIRSSNTSKKILNTSFLLYVKLICEVKIQFNPLNTFSTIRASPGSDMSS